MEKQLGLPVPPKKDERTPEEILASLRQQATEKQSDIQTKLLAEIAEAERKRAAQHSP